MNALKVRGLLLLFLSSVSIFSPETLSADPRNKFQGPRSEEILRDPHFENGFAVSPLWPAIVQNNGGFEKTNTDTIRFRKKECVPDWQMAQWASKYDLGELMMGFRRLPSWQDALGRYLKEIRPES